MPSDETPAPARLALSYRSRPARHCAPKLVSERPRSVCARLRPVSLWRKQIDDPLRRRTSRFLYEFPRLSNVRTLAAMSDPTRAEVARVWRDHSRSQRLVPNASCGPHRHSRSRSSARRSSSRTARILACRSRQPTSAARLSHRLPTRPQWPSASSARVRVVTGSRRLTLAVYANARPRDAAERRLLTKARPDSC